MTTDSKFSTIYRMTFSKIKGIYHTIQIFLLTSLTCMFTSCESSSSRRLIALENELRQQQVMLQQLEHQKKIIVLIAIIIVLVFFFWGVAIGSKARNDSAEQKSIPEKTE